MKKLTYVCLAITYRIAEFLTHTVMFTSLFLFTKHVEFGYVLIFTIATVLRILIETVVKEWLENLKGGGELKNAGN